MAVRRIGQVDLSTGEVLEDATLAVFYPKRKNGFIEGWIAMAQAPMVKLAEAKLGGEALSVFLLLCGKLDFENLIVVNQTELAKQLGTQQPGISRAIARLVEEGVVLQGPRVSGRVTYRLNPSYGWKGSAKNHHAALRERMKVARIERVV